jgi:hypothetical protein
MVRILKLDGMMPRQETDNHTAFWKGNERFYIRGVDYQPGKN